MKPKYVWDGYNVWGERNGTPAEVAAHRAKMGLPPKGAIQPSAPTLNKPESNSGLEMDRAAEGRRMLAENEFKRVQKQLARERALDAIIEAKRQNLSPEAARGGLSNTSKKEAEAVKDAKGDKWVVGDRAVAKHDPAEALEILAIHGGVAWCLTDGGARLTYFLNDLTRPAPRKRTVTLRQYELPYGGDVWCEYTRDTRWKDTGKSVVVEVEGADGDQG